MQRRQGGPAKKFEIVDDHGKLEPVALNAPPVDAEQQALEDTYREYARDRYAAPSNDDIEVDADAKVSMNDDGAFVQAWVYVSDYDCGIVTEDD
jgi:hypothetical protein